MKELILALAAVWLLGACSSNEATPAEDIKEDIEKDTLSEDAAKNHMLDAPDGPEAYAQIKEASEPAIFTELNADQLPAGKRVKVTGKVALTTKSEVPDTFSLTADDGVYTIMLTVMNLLEVKKIKEGNTITVYGVVSTDKAKDGSPIIEAGIIE